MGPFDRAKLRREVFACCEEKKAPRVREMLDRNLVGGTRRQYAQEWLDQFDAAERRTEDLSAPRNSNRIALATLIIAAATFILTLWQTIKHP